ncbi:MAG: nucleotide exchange factor GrpE, partial [Treponema sp.]|nr:nucleotide exchange factor GrpE [Treponema sp.]
LRAVADFQNLRKRSIQEKQEAFDYANTNLLKDLLDSLDNFDRTVEAASSATDPKTIADGVTMINKSMVSMLENKYDLVAYGAVGDAFNPDIHEAIGKSDDPVAEPVLKAVYLKGYKLKDRVIRHAKVMVSMPDGSVKAEDTGDSKAENAEESK